jgi:hypothetical protein
MGREKRTPLTKAELRQMRIAARYAPKTSNIRDRAVILVPPDTKSLQFKSPFSSKKGIVVIPPEKAGAKPSPLRRNRYDRLPAQVSAKKSGQSAKKDPQLPPVLGAMRFQDGVRFVQGGLPELGRFR